jgi:hypothetical protein
LAENIGGTMKKKYVKVKNIQTGVVSTMLEEQAKVQVASNKYLEYTESPITYGIGKEKKPEKKKS